MNLNENSLKALREFHKIISDIDTDKLQRQSSHKGKAALLQHQLRQKLSPHQLLSYNDGHDVTSSVSEDSADINLTARQEMLQDLFDFLITAKEHLLTIISPKCIKEPITDFPKFHLEITLIINSIESNDSKIKLPNNYGKIISRVIGIAIKSTMTQIGERKDDFPNYKLLNELAQLFTDDGTISPENEGKIPEYAEKLADLLSANQYQSEKNKKVSYIINEQELKKFCRQILYTAIANYKNDVPSQQPNHSTPTYAFSVNSLYSQSELEVLTVMRACYNERTGKVSGLPIWPCHNLINSIMSLSDTTLKAPEKRRIKTDLETGTKKFIQDNNLPILFYYLDEEERYIYQIATTICQKLPNTTEESCTITIELPTDVEEQTQEPTKLELTKENCVRFRNQIKNLHDANDFIASEEDRNKDETFELLFETIKDALETLKILLEGHGISITPPQPTETNTKRKNLKVQKNTCQTA